MKTWYCTTRAKRSQGAPSPRGISSASLETRCSDGSVPLRYTHFVKVTLKLFAAVRDIVGTSSIEIDPGEGATPADVWRDLTMRHPELGVHRIPMIAINEEYAKEDEVLHDGDELAFIPPVSGG